MAMQHYVASRGSATLVAPRRRSGWRRHYKYYVYLAPTFILLLIFGYYPPLIALYQAFFNWDGIAVDQFVALQNFFQMGQDLALRSSVVNAILLLVVAVFANIVPPLAVAELIFNLRSHVAKYWYRLILVVPIVVPIVVIWLLWYFFYDPDAGLFNGILRALHLPTMGFLTSPAQALPSLMFIGFPWVSGIAVLIYLAALNNIGDEILDAARIDGALGFRRVRTIDFPLVLGQVKLLSVLAIIGSLQGYALQLVLTKGGPGYATEVPGYVMYQEAFSYQRLGYACSIGLVLFLVILTLTYINLRYVRSSVEYEA
jgi:raffinose/stachyose/melibiose transport system permease protein